MTFNREKAKQLVLGSKLKRSAIAEECGVETTTITRYLNGHADPSLAVVKHMARVLNVPVTEIYAEPDPKQEAS